MKLLIVDDEELTRIGVISSIDWNSLGIEEVLQADDGINGLEAARSHRPEIILCDVRMPRMDGITMLSHLESTLPDTVPIFMSGYSDKEYLKAAIKLKAVSYIEKPLDPSEIREAVSEAVELYKQKVRSRKVETLQSMETASRLAMLLTAPYPSDGHVIEDLVEELSIQVTPSTSFTAVIVKLNMDLEFSGPPLNRIYEAIRKFFSAYHLDCIFVEKRVQHLVYFVYGPALRPENFLKNCREFFCSQFGDWGKFFIAAGETVTGISRAYQSYASAVILLQNSFFFPSGTLLSPSFVSKIKQATSQRSPVPSPDKTFEELLSSKDEEGAFSFLDGLYEYFNRNLSVLPNQAKDLYSKLLRKVDDVRTQLQISFLTEQENIIDALEGSFTFCDLHDKLLVRTRQFFQDAKNTVQENPTVFLIKDYIGKNYMNEALSVKDISTHVFLSASYVCTFFKNETGQTLNQYLTEYRMEKAKQLLLDPRYKISDISSKVGYSDGNYFGKSFKKYTGLSPSEYRETMS